MDDERDREIADLRAEVRRLSRALGETGAGGEGDLEPRFSHGLRGDYFGFVQVIIGGFVLMILLKLVHQLSS